MTEQRTKEEIDALVAAIGVCRSMAIYESNSSARRMREPLLFEISRPAGWEWSCRPATCPSRPLDDLLPAEACATTLPLPELSEPEVIRHFTHLSQRQLFALTPAFIRSAPAR